MADGEQPQETPAPTPEQQAAIAGAMGEAAAGSSTAQEARERARAAVDRTAQRENVRLSDEDKSELVDMFIDRLDGMGAFQPPPAAPPAAPAQTPEQAAETLAEAEAHRPPEKKTFAERFAGL